MVTDEETGEPMPPVSPSLNSIIEPMTEAVLVLDPTGLVVAVNESLLTLSSR